MSNKASRQLDRILYILPRAAVEGGVDTGVLAQELGVDRDVIVEDIHQVLGRAYYHPAATGSEVQALFTGDRVTITTTGEFRRPTGLSEAEGLAVALALRVRVAGAGAEDPQRAYLPGLVRRLEALARPLQALARPLQASARPTPRGREVYIESMDPRAHIRDALVTCQTKQESCRIVYLGADDPEPTLRTIQPYALANGDGRWYVIAFCELRQDVRVFRFDRVLEVSVLYGSFLIPTHFDAAEYTEAGRVHDTDACDEVEVLYAPNIARWVRERWEGEDKSDGAFLVRHQVSDPNWLVSHVMQYAGAAEVVAPERYRGLVRTKAEALLAASVQALA